MRFYPNVVGSTPTRGISFCFFLMWIVQRSQSIFPPNDNTRALDSAELCGLAMVARRWWGCPSKVPQSRRYGGRSRADSSCEVALCVQPRNFKRESLIQFHNIPSIEFIFFIFFWVTTTAAFQVLVYDTIPGGKGWRPLEANIYWPQQHQLTGS